MKRLVEFTLDDGTPVYIEVVEEARGEVRKVGRGAKAEDEPEKAGAFKKALGHIKPAAQAVLDAFKDFNTPDEIALEFALKLSGKTHVFVFSSDTEATFKVALKWENKKAEAGKVPG